MSPVSLSDSVWLDFGTCSSTTGAAANADSTPTVTIAEDGTNMAYSPTVSNVATGLYRVQIDATSGNGFESGKRYSVYVTATVGGITGRDGIGEFEVIAVDLNTGVASVQGNVTGSVASVTAAVTLPTIPTNWLTANGIAADAVAEIQSGLSTLTQADIRTAVGLASANLDTQLDALPTAAEIVAAMLTTAITEAYRANGSAPTLAQFMSEVIGHLGEMSISGTTKTVKKFDHTTTALTFTLNSATAPTAIERTS